jgi:hypothetical protein
MTDGKPGENSTTEAKPNDPTATPKSDEAAHRCPIIIDRAAARGHMIRDLDAFGANSPQWTIPSSRHEPKPFFRGPDPCRYNVPRLGCVMIPGSPMSPRPIYSDSTITSSIDTPDIRVYPTNPRKTIGIRKQTIFYEPTDSPGHFFNFKSDGLSKGLRIGRRFSRRGEDLPGPGEYSPAWPQTPRLTTVSKARDRTLWKIREGPSPADYTIAEPSTPKWRGAIRPLRRRLYTDE